MVREYHGTSVRDPYEGLEGKGDAVRSWGHGQNAHARRLLDAVPGRYAITARVRELLTASPDWYAPRREGGNLFVVEHRPPKQQTYLAVMDEPDPTAARTLLDPDVLGPEGGTRIDW